MTCDFLIALYKLRNVLIGRPGYYKLYFSLKEKNKILYLVLLFVLLTIRSILPQTFDSQMQGDNAINYVLWPLAKCTITDISCELGVLDRFYSRNVKVNSTRMQKPSLNYD